MQTICFKKGDHSWSYAIDDVELIDSTLYLTHSEKNINLDGWEEGMIYYLPFWFRWALKNKPIAVYPPYNTQYFTSNDYMIFTDGNKIVIKKIELLHQGA